MQHTCNNAFENPYFSRVSTIKALISITKEIGRPIPARNELQEGPLPEAQRSVVFYGSETYPSDDTLYKDSKTPVFMHWGFYFAKNLNLFVQLEQTSLVKK